MNKVVFIMAGGTGGHVYPALAVAKGLKAQGYTPVWLGTASALESWVVPAEGFILETIKISGLRGKKIKRLLSFPKQFYQAFLQVLKLYKKYKPVLAVGFGGYVAGPGGIVAWLKSVPLVLHEQNTVAGITNKILSRFADKVCQSFSHTFKTEKVVLTGNPVREDICHLFKSRLSNDKEPLKILVLGGSQGSSFINELMPRVLSGLTVPVMVRHQAGKDKDVALAALYQQYLIPAEVFSFIHAMDEAYAWADLVIARAGATTIAELSVVGIASILIPYPHAVDDHQTANANYLAKKGGAVIMPQANLEAKKMIEIITHFSKDRSYLSKMGSIAKTLGNCDATDNIVKVCLDVIEQKQKIYFYKKSYHGKN